MARLVIVGAGLAGLAAAVAAHDNGHVVTVLEKGDQVGGAAAFSGGQVWIAANHVQVGLGIDDDVESAGRYVTAIADAQPELLEPDTMWRWLRVAPRAARHFERVGCVRWRVLPDYPDYYMDAPGACAAGRYLTAVFDARSLGEWRERLRVTTQFPVGRTYDDLFGHGEPASAFGARDDGATDPGDLLTFGPGVVAGFLAAAVTRGIDIRLGLRVTELMVDETGGVAGARAVSADGSEAEFEGAVLLATSGFDWDTELAGRFLGIGPDDGGSVAPRTLTGDGLRLATEVGGAVVEFPRHRVPIVPGYPDAREPGFATLRENGLPHTFVVDRSGRRFADEALYWEVIEAVLTGDRLPCWMVWDEQHHRKYGLGSTAPGDPYPPDLVTAAATLRELAERIGVDADELERTAARFNDFAARGEDPDFQRGKNGTRRMFGGDPRHEPNPNLGPVAEAPFYAMRLRMVSTGINLTGIRVDQDARVLDGDGRAVPGLTAAGSCAAFSSSGTGYNSGFSLSRALTFGLIAAETFDAPPSHA